MVNRISFDGRDAGAAPHLWAFSQNAEPPECPDSVEPFQAGLWIDRDRPTVHLLSRGAAFVPEFYEMNYAYPLLVWLAAPDESPDDFEQRMTGVSPRNCLGLQLPIDAAAGTGQLLETVRDVAAELRETWHVHTERIIAAGAGPHAEAALRALLAKPEWFGGAVAVDAAFSQLPVVPLRNPELRGKRVLLGTTSDAVEPPHSPARLLQASGMSVAVRQCHNAAAALADVNAWLMEGICVAV